MASLVCSNLYLLHLQPSVSNDYWWPGFNTSGIQTFLADLFNAKLSLPRTGRLDLTNAALASVSSKSYASPYTQMQWSSSYARQLALADLPLAQVVAAMRMNSLDVNWSMFPAYCWLDLARTFHMAHTAKRQLRCDRLYQTNGAVYMELLLRNVDPDSLFTSSWASAVNVTILAFLRSNAGGQAWLDRMQSHVRLAAPDEVDAWRAAGIASWTNQLQNLYEVGLIDAIAIENAFGYQQKVVIKKTDLAMRGLGLWTSYIANLGIWNELNTCQGIGGSVIRQASNSVDAMNSSWDGDLFPMRTLPGVSLLREFLGPFTAIDITWVAKPPPLIDSVSMFQDQFAAMAEAVLAIAHTPPIFVDPVPSAWTDAAYYGGNPLCPYGDPMPYVQSSFSYTDSCGSQEPLRIRVSPAGAAFALLLGDHESIATACALCSPSAALECLSLFQHVHAVTMALAAPSLNKTAVQQARDAAGAVNLSLMQMAHQGADDVVLTQSLVAPGPFSLFGWVMVYDWIVGSREVYRFEGDNGAITLMSEWNAPLSMAANPLELPQNACNFIWYLSVYVSFVLTCVGVGVVGMAVRTRPTASGPVLFHFNRVVGSVWIGRPILGLRSMAALMVLSTASVGFDTSEGGVSSLRATSRPWHFSMMLCGEATWLSYVVHDICLPLFGGYDAISSRTWVSLATTWGVLFAFDQASPLAPTAIVNPQCKVEMLGLRVTCESGVVYIGSLVRLRWLALICLVVPWCVQLVLWAVSRVLRENKAARDLPRGFVSWPAALVAVVGPSPHEDTSDSIALAMAGFLPTLSLTKFNIALWQSMHSKVRVAAVSPVIHGARRHVARFVQAQQLSHRPWIGEGVALVGFVYVVGTIYASSVYVGVTRSTMANDFWWSTFNSSGHQTFLANWFNVQLQLTSVQRNVRLDGPEFGEVGYDYSTSDTSIDIPRHYASLVLNEVHSLSAVVQGLRDMDGCVLPWIATSYCYVDFDQTWEMAVSAARQAACQRDSTSNGAVFLEPMLRNGHWPTLMECWGPALKTGVFNAVSRTSQGKEWLATVASTALSVPEEAALWRRRGIDHYTVQWQSFKTHGVAEVFSIQNAFGLAYPITIKKILGKFHGGNPTSLKLQWPLAKWLGVVGTNSTDELSGYSLVRDQPNSLLSNTTVEDVLFQSHTIALPFGPALDFTRAFFGPFGTSLMFMRPPPEEIRTLVRTLLRTIQTLRGTSRPANDVLASLSDVQMYFPMPAAWRDAWCAGGNFMCDATLGSDMIALYYTSDGECSFDGTDTIIDAAAASSMAAVLASQSATTAACDHEMQSKEACVDTIEKTTMLASTLLRPDVVAALKAMAAAARAALEATVTPHLFQFLRPRDDDASPGVSPSILPLFHDDSFDFFSWMYVFEWVRGAREVVEFHGQTHAKLAVLSGLFDQASMVANAQEIPQNVALYLRSALQYVTFVLLCVASLVGVSILVNRGHVEGANMFQFNRVAAVVWIGRPLMVLRGVTAICLLSTASLDLTRVHGNFCQFASRPPDTVTTLLSSGEMGWVVYVVNDVMSVFTHRFTYDYAWKSCVLVWLVAAVWSILLPVEHVVTVDRHCAVDAVDFQLTCHGGTVAIGRFDRFWGLLVVAAVSCVVCYAVERVRNTAVHPRRSVVLHSAAQYQFDQANWMFQGVYHMDTSSAILNGLLVVPYRSDKVVFDIKSWRVFVLEPTASLPPRYRACIPLHD